jgi:hypothetical protein
MVLALTAVVLQLFGGKEPTCSISNVRWHYLPFCQPVFDSVVDSTLPVSHLDKLLFATLSRAWPT